MNQKIAVLNPGHGESEFKSLLSVKLFDAFGQVELSCQIFETGTGTGTYLWTAITLKCEIKLYTTNALLGVEAIQLGVG